MSDVKKLNYGEKAHEAYNLRTAMEEASRCLLCEDAPCSKGCPAETNPGKFIRSIRFRNPKGAAETIRTNNILGGSCALVCPYDKLCEEECARCGIDRPIKIGKLQEFAVNVEKETGLEVLKAPDEKNGKKVACIGGGPVSLAVATKLALAGCDVTIYEQHAKAGGVLTYGITPSRLPQETVDFDISKVKNLGVNFELNHKVNADELQKLQQEFDAVFVGVGLWKSVVPNMLGTDLNGVVSALDFLKVARENNGQCELGENVYVIGGGDVAIDCATTAKQLGANTAIVYRRTIEEAPANRQEWDFLFSLGVPVYTKFSPVEMKGENGQLTSISFKSMDNDNTMELKADQVIFAVGQNLDDDYTDVRENEKVFVAGDAVNGGQTVVQAVKEGKETASKILQYLGVNQEAK